MLYSEIIAVCSQIHTKHTNTLCGQNVECRTYRAVNTLPPCYKNQSVPSSVDSKFNKNGTESLSRNVGTELPLYAAQYPRTAQIE